MWETPTWVGPIGKTIPRAKKTEIQTFGAAFSTRHKGAGVSFFPEKGERFFLQTTVLKFYLSIR